MRGPSDEAWNRLVRLQQDDERELAKKWGQRHGMAFADLDRVRLEPETLALITPEMARELQILPLKRDGNTLWVGNDNVNKSAIDVVKDATGLRVIPCCCTSSALDDALESL